jgi:arginyl-tRNA synthetase
MPDLALHLTAATAQVFAKLGLDERNALVRRSERTDLGDFQCNGALAIAKALGRKPMEVATAVADAWTATELSDKPTVAAPGFLNYRIPARALSARAQEIVKDPRGGAAIVEPKRRVLIDYGGPNVAKPMHVGHLRASIIGESLKRIFRFRGDEVIGDAHFGDWGFQMGLLIIALEDRVGELSDQDRLNQTLQQLTLEDLDTLYPAAAARAKADGPFRERARKATLALQSGNPAHRQIWQAMRDLSMAALKREFGVLGVEFDLWNGESDAEAYIPVVMHDLKTRQLLEHDQDAEIVRVSRPGDKREIPPLIVVSSEGSAMYGTTDLATIVQREREIDPDLYLYVVDQRQADHFCQVFRAAVAAGWAEENQLEHIGFGTMNGPDGKPFKTRAGGVLKLGDLMDMAREKARARLKEEQIGSDLEPAEFEEVASRVANAAVKFADLINFRGTSYLFDLDRFTSFEGKTGPYLLYAVARIKSLLRNAAEQGFTPGPVNIAHAAERELALVLDELDAAVTAAYDRRAPHLVAEHAFAVAQSFSSFYQSCPIVKEETDPKIRSSRLSLARATLTQLELSLDLLAVKSVERM